MKFHISRGSAIAWTFVLVTAASGVNLVLDARMYFLFYSALDKLQFTISRVSLQSVSSNMSSILIRILANNPEDYAGLKVTLVTATTYFASANYTLFYDSPLIGSAEIGQNLPVHGMALWNLTLAVGSRDNSALQAFYNKFYPKITASVSLTVQLSTFLDKALGLPTQLPLILQNATLT